MWRHSTPWPASKIQLQWFQRGLDVVLGGPTGDPVGDPWLRLIFKSGNGREAKLCMWLRKLPVIYTEVDLVRGYTSLHTVAVRAVKTKPLTDRVWCPSKTSPVDGEKFSFHLLADNYCSPASSNVHVCIAFNYIEIVRPRCDWTLTSM